jgi:hypothetical protein
MWRDGRSFRLLQNERSSQTRQAFYQKIGVTRV